jgi:glyoxylase-like metal-dependent hydrolase (beta-lactamase superfamily II)
MKIVHLNCGSMDIALFGHQIPIVLHCLLIETEDGLVLLDTGWGVKDYIEPERTVKWVMKVTGSVQDVNITAINQIRDLGYNPENVKHILMTHMHIDHTGGLPDFPGAKIHLIENEYDAIQNPISLIEKLFYIKSHWSHQPEWEVHKLTGETFYDFECTNPFDLGGVEFRFIPLFGHSRGHSGVLIKASETEWILHCGDAYVSYDLINLEKPLEIPTGLPGLIIENISLFNSVFTHVPRLRASKEQLGDNLHLLCSHDLFELQRDQGTI